MSVLTLEPFSPSESFLVLLDIDQINVTRACHLVTGRMNVIFKSALLEELIFSELHVFSLGNIHGSRVSPVIDIVPSSLIRVDC